MISKKVHNLPVKLDVAGSAKTTEDANQRENKEFLRVKGKVRAKTCLKESSDGL